MKRLAVVFVGFSLFASPAWGQEAKVEEGRALPIAVFDHLRRDARETFTKSHGFALGTAVGMAIVLAKTDADRSVASFVEERGLPGTATVGARGGAWYARGSFAGGMLLLGLLTDDAKTMRVGEKLAEAFVLSEGLAVGVKNVVGRVRPDRNDGNSFWSGHASGSFAVAEILRGEYGWKAGIPAYAFAGYVGYSRIDGAKHWLSDVVVGSVVGVVIGRGVLRAHKPEEKPLAFQPFYAREPVMVGDTVVGKRAVAGVKFAW